MPLLTLVNVSHAYGSSIVLDGATLSIEPGEKVGMVGRNGCGKTTLMKVILGQLKPDSGQVQLQRGARAGYLSQDPSFDPQDTLRDAAEGAFAELHRLHVELHQVYHDMAEAQGDDLKRLMRRQSELDGAIEAAGGYAIDHKIDATLHGLGFTDDQFTLNVANLSGGQKGRLGLARLLLEEPDLLLLDEPTNHLDIAGREWLENFLANDYHGAVLMVSHDRWMLDRVVDRIIEIEVGSVREYPGNYEKYIELRRERQLTHSRVYEKQQDKIRQEEAFIRRYKAGQRARQAKGRETRLDRYKRDELIDRPIELDVMNLRLPKVERSGDLVVVAEGLTKRYDDKVLFENLDLVIERGERIGIIGPNGAGKTTLVRTMLGEIEPSAGTVRIGSRLNVGYYRQLHDHLEPTMLVWEYIRSRIVGPDGVSRASEQQARDMAGAFLFSGGDQEKALGDLSGGERSRCVLAGLIGSAHNLLVLDEPTNHLDIPSSERLEQALSRDSGYEGTVILITHDRALLDSSCERLIILDGHGGATVFDGTYSEWVEKRDAAARAERDRAEKAARKSASRSSPAPAAASTARRPGKSDDPESWSMEQLESRIEELENRIRAIDAQLLDPDVYTDGRKCRALQSQRDELASQLEPLEFEWSRRAAE